MMASLPLGMMTWSPRSIEQIRTLTFRIRGMSYMRMPTMLLFSGTLTRIRSILPREKLSIFMSDGKRSRRSTSFAAAISGLMTIARFSSSRR